MPLALPSALASFISPVKVRGFGLRPSFSIKASTSHPCLTYVCMYVCIYVCVNVCMYAFMHVCGFGLKPSFSIKASTSHPCLAYVCMSVWNMYVCMICMYACIYVYLQTRTNTNRIHTYLCATCTYIRIEYIHTYMCVSYIRGSCTCAWFCIRVDYMHTYIHVEFIHTLYIHTYV